ncbi:MAG: hypothetical protein ACFNXW_00010 [Rothia dentocariosa]|uniref:hypothetical protein n=1 Tax=Rothia dentocariosa TaxID=2047 RepID=UPI003614C9F6
MPNTLTQTRQLEPVPTMLWTTADLARWLNSTEQAVAADRRRHPDTHPPYIRRGRTIRYDPLSVYQHYKNFETR